MVPRLLGRPRHGAGGDRDRGELLLGAAVIGMAAVAVLAPTLLDAQTTAITGSRSAVALKDATGLATDTLAQARAVPWGQVGLDSAAPGYQASGRVDPAGLPATVHGVPGLALPAVAAHPDPERSALLTPVRQATAHGARFTIHTQILWTAPTTIGPPATPGTGRKLVAVTVTWFEPVTRHDVSRTFTTIRAPGADEAVPSL